MNKDYFERKARLAGFTNPAQIEFMWEYLAKEGHIHKVSDVEGLEERLVREGRETNY